MNIEKTEFCYSPENYTMREMYDAEKLVVGKLEYISSEDKQFGRVIKTSQNYIFEPIIINGMVKYQEVFTGFIAGDSEGRYFDLPYMVNMAKLTEIAADYKQKKIPKLGMLLALNDINAKMVKYDNKNILNPRKTKNK